MDYKNMTDEELDKYILEHYGDGWKIEDIEEDEALITEFLDRISTGV